MKRGLGSRAKARVAVAVAQCLAALLLLGAGGVCAQRLPIRHYDVADGLAHSLVTAIHQDAKGYLWLGTGEGLSRFDGYRFINYGARDGLRHLLINTIVEDRQGRLWVGTNGGGVARLIDDPQEALSLQQAGAEPAPSAKFVSYFVGDSPESNRVNAMLFGADGILWCATDDGLYRSLTASTNDPKFEVVVPYSPKAIAMAALADDPGRLWFAIYNDLIEVVAGRIIRYSRPGEVRFANVYGMVRDRQGRLLVAYPDAVFEFIAPTGTGSGQWRRLRLDLRPDQQVHALFLDSAGALWVGTTDGLIKYEEGQQTLYTTANGMSDNDVGAISEDRDGNLWAGTRGNGVCELTGETIASIRSAEGLPDQKIAEVIEARDGRVYALTMHGGAVAIVGEKAEPLPQSRAFLPDALGPLVMQDRRGDWWVGTAKGLFRFPGPRLRFRHGRKFTQSDGVSEAGVLAGPYEDSDGRIWVSTVDDNLYRSSPVGNGRPIFERVSGAVSRIFSDRSGTIWLTRWDKSARWVNGKEAVFHATEGLPDTQIRAFYQDSRGWVWLGLRTGGVSMTIDPNADRLKCVNYSTENGLASNTVWSITEDDFGRIYLGTGRGLDQLDPFTGQVRHFTTKNGLAGDVVYHCMKDSHGDIWLATSGGVSKFNPRAERKQQQANVYLSRIQVAGEDLSLPERGTLRAPPMTLPASQNNLLIEYVALDFQGELKYQYKLVGVDRDWSAPTERRAVNYASLAPGSYHFLVRAINQEGIPSDEPATLEFRILAPVWQRWWFLMLATVFVGVVIYAAHRRRVARLIELERVRTRIASDLHDDIGADLSRIALLSEVARRQVSRDDSQVTEWLSSIASISRKSVDSMSDIVWAINPNRDRLSDLTQRMRRFSSDIFTARNIEFQFRAPGADQDMKLGVDLRREVYLIFKESVNNMVRHSGCTHAEVEFQNLGGWLVLKLSDNGKGFDCARTNGGQGLASMRQRAQNLGGKLELISHNGDGTTVILRAPLGRI